MRTNRCIRYGDVELDVQTRLARCGTGSAVCLTPKECALLAAFLRAPGRVYTRAALLAEVWQAPGALRTRTVDMHVRALRQKLGAGHRIVTVYRRGYMWQPPAAGGR